MIRMLRRTLRTWKRDFLGYWGKLTTFYRIVLGILLAMGLVAGGRSRFLDPMERELTDLRRTLERRGVPGAVHTPDTCPDLAEDRLRRENLERSLENRRDELRAVEAQTALRLEARAADAAARLLALVSQNGLRVQSNQPLPPPEDIRPPVLWTRYDLRGGFEGILSFLDAFAAEPLLWELRDLHLQVPPAGGAGGLRLSFTLQFTPYPDRNP